MMSCIVLLSATLYVCLVIVHLSSTNSEEALARQLKAGKKAPGCHQQETKSTAKHTLHSIIAGGIALNKPG